MIRFQRTPQGTFIEVPEKAWSINQSDTRASWGNWDFCLVDFEVGVADGPELCLISRTKGDVEWMGVGPASGSVYMSNPSQGRSWEQDMGIAGGFDAWWAQIMLRINGRLAPLCAQLNPTLPACQMTLAAPAPVSMASWNVAMAWLYANVKWGDAAPSVPGTPAGSGKPGNGWKQFTAGQQDMAFRTFVDEDGVQRYAVYRKDGPGQFTFIPPALADPG